MIECDHQVLWLRNCVKSSNKQSLLRYKKPAIVMLSTYTASLIQVLKSWKVLQDRWVLRISHNMGTPNILLASKRTCKDTQKFLLKFWSVRSTRSSRNIFTYIPEFPLFWFFFQKYDCYSLIHDNLSEMYNTLSVQLGGEDSWVTKL